MNLEVFKGCIPETTTPLASREGILYAESKLMETFGNSPWEGSFPLTHRFADGVYAREMLIPAGHVIVGKIHKYGHLNVISSGAVSVLTEFGVEVLCGPTTFISKPGTKRVVYAHEDTVWTTFHGTDHTDPDMVENDIICKTFAEFDNFVAESNKLEDRS